MIKMFGVGASRTHIQVVVISMTVAVGFRSKTAKERKTCRVVYSGTCASGQVAPKTPNDCVFTAPAKASVP